MTTMQTDRLVDDYLSRLEEAAAHLQRSRRAELIAEIREHIEAALREEEAASEVAVRNVLERLGPPEEIVDAAEPAPAAEQRSAFDVLYLQLMITHHRMFADYGFTVTIEDDRQGGSIARTETYYTPRNRSSS